MNRSLGGMKPQASIDLGMLQKVTNNNNYLKKYFNIVSYVPKVNVKYIYN